MVKIRVIIEILASVLIFWLVLSGCATTGDQNNIGEIIGDDFALVRAPAIEVVNGKGMQMVSFAGNDLTIWNKYKITPSIAGIGRPTIDLKVTPGNHEFTIVWLYDTETKIITLNYDFKAGKWYEFKSHILLGGSAPIAMQEGTLETGKPKGKTEEVTTFQMENYNSDEVAPKPQQVSFKGAPGKVSTDKMIITLKDSTHPGQVILMLSDGYKFGPNATAANIVKWWLTYPTYPITVSPEHCTGIFSPDGTQILLFMNTSNNRPVTSGQVGFKIAKAWNNYQVFMPDASRSIDFVIAEGRYPTLD